VSNVTPIRNHGPECAEMYGGNCPGDACVYRNDDSLPLAAEPFGLENWSPRDPRLAEVQAELRGFRQGTREVHARIEAAVIYTLVSVIVGAAVVALIAWAATR
jgi:hypothetical protein